MVVLRIRCSAATVVVTGDRRRHRFHFAVHPVHVRVGGVDSGSPDLLMAAALLGPCGWCCQGWRDRTGARRPAVGPVHGCAAGQGGGNRLPGRGVRGGGWSRDAWHIRLAGAHARHQVALPFAVLAVVYFVVRALLLGQVARTNATQSR